MKKSLALLLGLLLLGVGLFGQSLTSVSGSVTDPTGAVLPRANLQLENVDTGMTRETVSDSLGLYAFPQIPPGNYQITARAQGFVNVTVENIRLLVNSPATIRIQFTKVGAVAETVSVSAETIQINTTDATLGNAISGQSIAQLPFEARNVVGLLALQPGVTFTGDAGDYRSGAVNGGKSDQANVTLDGVDVNDQQNRTAFTSVLRVTLDSVQELRVTTANPNADMGRTSGAQIALVTKSGTNNVHGALYEYLRNTATSANTFFNNAAVPAVERPTLNRNVFGASVGGPVRKNRLFYFLNYEGRREKSEATAVRIVPSELLRQGIVQYIRTDGSVAQLSPADIRTRVDPMGRGANPAVLEIFRSYPQPNDFTQGDNLNSVGFRFKAPQRGRQNTYIAKLDYVVDADNKHQVFWRGNLQNDNFGGLPQFPGAPPNNVDLNNSKGYAFGYNALLKPTLISVTRYGYTRQGTESTGIQTASAVSFRGFSDRYGLTRGLSQIVPVHHISQDFTWTRGSHSIQWGGTLRWIRNSRVNFANSFHSASTNSSWLRGIGGDLHADLPDLRSTFRTAFRDATMALLGIVSQGNAQYNYDIQGNVHQVGAPVRRTFAGEEYEMYLEDTWRVNHALTVTAGLRYSLMPPIYEANGVQTSTDQSIGQWFNKRGALAEQGRSQLEAGRVTFILANGPGGRPLYDFHKKNFAPRLGLAYSPHSSDGWRKFLFGGPGRTSIRAGWGMFYDLFGQGLMRSFDATAFGLSTRLTNPSGQLTSSTAPRFTGIFSLPPELIRPAPKGGFPQTYPDLLAITNSIDDTIRPPYSMSMNLSIGREFGHGIYIQGAYVGRLSRRSLIQRDLSMPSNLKDPGSGVSYFEAARQLADLVNARTPVAQVGRIPYWENLWPGLAGGGLTATQVAYNQFRANQYDWITALYDMDTACDPACSRLGRYAYFSPQFSALSAWSSIAGGNYHSMQWTVRKRFSSGTQFDFNYTWSKSIDLASNPERAATFAGFVVNSWFPGDRKGVSDYDVTQQWNANFVAELPFGRNKKWLSRINRPLDAILGGWQVAGLWRQTTELVASAFPGRNWATNWNITGFARQTGVVPAPKKDKNAAAVAGRPGPNVFSDPRAALAAYDFLMPGDTGQRNGIRGDGNFTIDLGVSKRFTMPYHEAHSVQFRWESFNLTNSVRFDADSLSLTLGSTGTFGKYSQVLTLPRVMQFSLRYEF